MASIAVVGAGLVGRFLALSLDQTHQVTLFEKGHLADTRATGRIAAAMVAPTAESVVASANIVEMGHQSLSLWPQMLNALDIETRFQQTGTLILAHRQDVNDLRHFTQRVRCRHAQDLQTLHNEQIQEIEPELPANFTSALFLANEGHIDNRLLYQETEAILLSSNVTCLEQTEVNIDDNRISDSNNNQQQWHFDWVIDCRGLGAKSHLLKPENALRGVRGEVVRVRAPEVSLTRPIRLMHPRYPLYIVPKSNNEYVIGATEIESEDTKAPSVRSTLELLSAAYSIHKGFAEAEVLEIQAGLRPTLLDNEPSIVIKSKHIQINGLYRHGYLLAPCLVDQTLRLLKGRGENIELFSRFQQYNVDDHMQRLTT